MIYQQTGPWGRKQNGAGTGGMDSNACGNRWGWIQTAQGRLGMGLKSCPHADLYNTCQYPDECNMVYDWQSKGRYHTR